MAKSNRITITAKITRIGSYTDFAFSYYGNIITVYTFVSDGKTYVWKTSSYLPDGAKKGDVVEITASVKRESEYNGEPQTELSRVKLVRIVESAKTWEEIRKEKIDAQLKSLADGDFIWEQMPYGQYKEHYSDCETLYDSFHYHRGRAYVSVIIRAGRLVPSGTRGKHYSGYEFSFVDDGERMKSTFRAVSDETAVKQLRKAFPNAESIELSHIYRYEREYV